MAIDYELVRGLERGLDQALGEGRRPTGAYALEHCAAMLQELASIAEETKILKKLERLREVRKELRKLSI